jgi:flagellar biosynthesis/type III secretory pathway chaperone
MTQYDPTAAQGLDALAECLEAEYEALLAEDHRQLEAVLARKEQLLARLSSSPGLGLGHRQNPAAGVPAAWKRLMERVRALNQRNATVLAPRAAVNRARLSFLQSALGGVALYAADGMTASGRINAGTSRSV